MLATAKTARPKIQECQKLHGTRGFRYYGANGHCSKDSVSINKRQVYLTQANGKEKSPKALDIRDSGDFLLSGGFFLNDNLRKNRPITARQISSTGANEKAIV